LKQALHDIPYWMARSMGDKQIVSLQPPECFGMSTCDEYCYTFPANIPHTGPDAKNRLKAGPEHVNLYGNCPYFYELGIKLAIRQGDEALLATLMEVFRIRYRRIFNESLNATSSSRYEYTMFLERKRW